MRRQRRIIGRGFTLAQGLRQTGGYIVGRIVSAVSMASENGNMIQSEKGSQSEAGAVKVAQSQSRLPIVANQLQHVR